MPILKSHRASLILDAEVVATTDVTLALTALSNSLLITQSSSHVVHMGCVKCNVLSLELEVLDADVVPLHQQPPPTPQPSESIFHHVYTTQLLIKLLLPLSAQC